jgi:hypothetical protein
MSPAEKILEGITLENAAAKSRRWLAEEMQRNPYPAERFTGRGIVIAAGGLRYGVCAYVAVRAIRHVGCTLPIEIWYRGPGEYLPALEDAMRPLGCRWIDAYAVREKYPHARLNGFELKPYAIQHCQFREVLFVDADNVAVRNPTYLFDDPRYQAAGTILWPDYHRLGRDRGAWQLFGLDYRDEPECESGQVLTDKSRSWPALLMADWYGQRSLLTFRHVHGDKELFHLGWRSTNTPYAMPARGIETLACCGGRHSTMCQHDLDGRRVFQHRNSTKWEFDAERNVSVSGFQLEKECLAWLSDLRTIFSPAAQTLASSHDQLESADLVGARYVYHRVGHDRRNLVFGFNGRFETGGAGREHYWAIRDGRLLIAGTDGQLTMDLTPTANGWTGRWLTHEQMPIQIVGPS